MAESFVINYDTGLQYKTNGGLELFWMLYKFRKDKICVYTERIAFNEDAGYICNLPIVDDDYLVESLFMFRYMHIFKSDMLKEIINTVADVQWTFEAMNRDILNSKESNIFAEKNGLTDKEMPWYILGENWNVFSLEDFKMPDVTDDRFMLKIQKSFEGDRHLYSIEGAIGVLRKYLDGHHFGLLHNSVPDVQKLESLQELVEINPKDIDDLMERSTFMESITLARYMLQLRQLLKEKGR